MADNDQNENNESNEETSDVKNESAGNRGVMTALIVVAVVAVVWVAATMVAENKAKSMVDRSVATLESDLSEQGREAKVSYESVDVEKFTLTPQVTLSNLVISLANSARGQDVSLEVPEVVYFPESFSMQNYRIEKRGDVLLHKTKGGVTDSIRVSHAQSPVLHVVRNNTGSRHYQIDVPEWIAFEELTADGTGDQMTLNIDNKASEIYWTQNAEGLIKEQQISLKNLTLVSGEEMLATIDAISFANIHQSTTEEAVHQFDSSFLVRNLQFTAPEMQALNPVDIVNEITYLGPLAHKLEQTEDTPEMRWKLKNVAWMSGLLKLYLNGNISVHPKTDKLPYGELTLRINDVDKLLGFVAEQKPETAEYLEKVETALERLSGTEVAEGETLAINLVREKNGHLGVGELTLEEALALVITVFMNAPEALTDLSEGPITDAQPVPMEEETVTEPETGDGASSDAEPDVVAPESDSAVELETNVEVTETDDGAEVTIEISPETGDMLEDDAETTETEAPATQPAE